MWWRTVVDRGRPAGRPRCPRDIGGSHGARQTSGRPATGGGRPAAGGWWIVRRRGGQRTSGSARPPAGGGSRGAPSRSVRWAGDRARPSPAGGGLCGRRGIAWRAADERETGRRWAAGDCTAGGGSHGARAGDCTAGGRPSGGDCTAPSEVSADGRGTAQRAGDCAEGRGSHRAPPASARREVEDASPLGVGVVNGGNSNSHCLN